MLELKNIRKAYVTAGFTQVALDDVSVAFRDNEFVAVLGAAGSGKTTMLNILGGLDHADSGDIVINGVSTKDYTDKDWDTYRNHRIGFIFQSYNLIPHQTVLSNVELALTLAGISHAERRERARAALERVGRGDHIHQRPSQLSGGQMQRVAIARALVNDPDIVLADEPTGALDTETGIQVMDLLKEIADERLVIMVTHNPELAEEYATRIVRLKDGRIVDDSDPIQAAPMEAPAGIMRDERPTRHASMSFLTALALSFNNLMTKKGRTFMTAFAGSIGIIGIAAILSLSNGVNDYIAKTEEEALSSYPLTITKSSFDLASLMVAGAEAENEADDAAAAAEKADASETTEASEAAAGTETTTADDTTSDQELIPEYDIMSNMFARVKNNDLASFKQFLESGTSGIEPYVSTIQYTYGVTPLIYKTDTSKGVVRLNPSKMSQTMTNGVVGSSFVGGMTAGAFQELLDDPRLLQQQAEVEVGRWPEAYDECVLVTTSGGWVSDYTLYSLGVHDTKVMEDMLSQALNGEDVEVPELEGTFTKEDALNLTFKVVPAVSLYQKNAEQGTWTDMTGDKAFMKKAVDDGITLKVVGIVHRAENATSSSLSEGIAYSPLLTKRLMEIAADAQIVAEQQARPEVDVFTGKTFEELQNDEQNELDMDSIFTVDEDKLQQAFSFDSSALEGFGQGMDLSGIDLSSSMGSLDFSNLQLDSSAIQSAFSEDTIRQVMANAPQFSLTDAELIDPEQGLTEEQRAKLEEAGNQLASGFMAWATINGKFLPGPDGQMNFAGALEEYMQTEEALAIVTPLTEELTGTAEELVNNAMRNYMENQFAPYLSAALTELMTQAANAMSVQLASQLQTQMAAATGQIGSQLANAISSQMAGQMESLQSSLENAFSFDANAFSDAIHFNMTQDDLASLLSNYMNAEELSYDANLKNLGYATLEDPESISIYPIDFPSKEAVLGIIDAYNEDKKAAGEEDSSIVYSDFAGVLMGSVTDIVNTVSLVLIAFVSISLVVSSIMISIITYISVLERKKEIGILRAMGASKLNVANIFNAETVIEGFIAGVLAIAVVYAASLPVNAYILETRNVPNIMQLPWESALTLVGVSVGLTLIAGLIPSSAAARRDPVEALRSE